MIHLIIALTVKDAADVQTVAGLLREQGRLSCAEPGCVRFEVYHSSTEARAFFLNEWWESAEALDAHRKARAYTEIYQPRVLPLVERVPHPSTLVE